MPKQRELPTFGILDFLAEEGLQLAPRVAAILCKSLRGDREAILETASSLTAAQRSGLSVIPDPLPLLPVVERAVRAEVNELTVSERAMLLRASVCVQRRTSVLLASCKTSMADAAASKVAEHLSFVAGSFEFNDPRIRAAVHAQASLADRNRAHADLVSAFDKAGEANMAHWHKTLSTVEGDAELTHGLLAIGAEALEQGEVSWAYAIAREAACHAPAELAQEARLFAAETALHNGCLIDAAEWIGSAPATSASAERMGRLAATTHAHIEELISGKLPRELHVGKSASASPARADSLSAEYVQVAEAFRYAEEDLFDLALKSLSNPPKSRRYSPLVLAVRRMARALVLLWSGNLSGAIAEFNNAVLSGPAELVLGGVAGVFSQRLDTMVHGHIGAISISLKKLPGSQHDPAAALSDRAVLAYLKGQTAEVATLLAVSAEHQSKSGCSTIYLPSLTETTDPSLVRSNLKLGSLIGRSAQQREHAKLRLAVSSSGLTNLSTLASAAVNLGQQPTSPFERGRTEFALGRAFRLHHEHSAARRYLLAAASSFEESGAWAWLSAAEAELQQNQSQEVSLPAVAALDVTPGPFDSLTEREAEVAVLVAEGNSNREVALRLHLSVRTVEVHLSRVFAKLGVRSRVELSILAHRAEGGLGHEVG